MLGTLRQVFIGRKSIGRIYRGIPYKFREIHEENPWGDSIQIHEGKIHGGTLYDYQHYKKSDFCINKVTFSIPRTSQQGFEKYFSLASEPASPNIRQMVDLTHKMSHISL